LAKAGVAECVLDSDATPETLATVLLALLRDDQRRLTMSDKARERGHNGAAMRIADDLLNLTSMRPHRLIAASCRRRS
ncbi:MAG: hypothetical protein NZM33_17880, partial [Bryobacteraceae bacterium]|nr:hypothetical protein [Bryobacteraceae bacterium]